MKKDLMAEVRNQLRQEQEAQRHIDFIRGLEGKTFSELSLQERNYLYTNHKKLYERINEDKSLAVYDIETLDRLKAQEQHNKKKLEEAKAKFIEEEEAKTEEQKRIEKMIDDSITKTLKKFGL